MKRLWLITVLLFAAAAFAHLAASGTDHAPLRPPAFLETLAPGGPPFVGVVVEEIAAGGYTYRWIRTDDGELDWVVDLGNVGRLGQRVKVRPFGLATDFRSARTGRVFDSLYFAIVRQEETT